MQNGIHSCRQKCKQKQQEHLTGLHENPGHHQKLDIACSDQPEQIKGDQKQKRNQRRQEFRMPPAFPEKQDLPCETEKKSGQNPSVRNFLLLQVRKRGSLCQNQYEKTCIHRLILSFEQTCIFRLILSFRQTYIFILSFEQTCSYRSFCR